MQNRAELAISQESFNIARAEIDIQIATAKAYPRDDQGFVEKAIRMATKDRDTAEACCYELPRVDKNGAKMNGPSVRLAEICATAWGNLRYGARVIDLGTEYATIQGAAHDLESNVAIFVDVAVRLLDKNGRRYSTDVLISTVNAGIGKGKRNGVFAVIPRVYVNQVYDAVRHFVERQPFSLDEQVDGALCYFKGRGISHEQVYHYLGRRARTEIKPEDIVRLKQVKAGLEEGEIQDDVFALRPVPVQN